MKTESLQQIKRFALALARVARGRGEEMRPVIMAFTANGEELGDVGIAPLVGLSKDAWAAIQQRLAREPACAAAVLVCEAWTKRLNEGETIPENLQNEPGRTEVLQVNVLTAGRQWLMFAPIEGETIQDAEFQEITRQSDNSRWEGRFIREESKTQ